MTIRIKHKVRVQIAEDTDMKNLLFSRDDTLSEKIIDAYVRQTSGKFNIAASANEDLPFGDITTVKGMYIEVDQDVQVKLNGSNDAIQLRKSSSTEGVTAQMFLEADISQVNVTAGSDAVNGTFCFWGDTS